MTYTQRQKETAVNATYAHSGGFVGVSAADLWDNCHELAKKLQHHQHDITKLARRFYRIALQVAFDQIPLDEVDKNLNLPVAVQNADGTYSAVRSS